jgi:hypothetical protein
MVLSALASMAWMLDGAPGGRLWIVMTLTFALAGLSELPARRASDGQTSTIVSAAGSFPFLGDLTSAAVLGSALTAMLIGHSYLIAPAMSLVPLYRMLTALAVSLVLRAGAATAELWLWTADGGTARLTKEMTLWLAVRWIVGLIGPLVLCWLAWETTRIRSTQSATGIVYVVVILCFLGELTSQLILAS